MVLCFVSSRRRHTRCALVTGVQTCALPIYSDYSQVKYELPPGSTLEQSETIARQIGAILDNSPVVDTAFYDINVGGGNAFLTLTKHRDVSSVERSEEHTSELQSLMRISYAVFCLKKKISTL